MHYTTTISQKGQVVVPKDIREKLKLKASDTLYVRLSDNKNIILEPASSTEDHLGMFAVNKSVTKRDIKDSYKGHVNKKFK